VPSVAPRNLTFELSEQQLSLTWAKLQEDELQGKLLAYKVQWTLGGEAQVRGHRSTANIDTHTHTHSEQRDSSHHLLKLK